MYPHPCRTHHGRGLDSKGGQEEGGDGEGGQEEGVTAREEKKEEKGEQEEEEEGGRRAVRGGGRREAVVREAEGGRKCQGRVREERQGVGTQLESEFKTMYYSVIIQFTLMTGVHYVMTNVRGSNSMASVGMHKGWDGVGREWLALQWEGGQWLPLPRARISAFWAALHASGAAAWPELTPLLYRLVNLMHAHLQLRFLICTVAGGSGASVLSWDRFCP